MTKANSNAFRDLTADMGWVTYNMYFYILNLLELEANDIGDD